MPKSLGDGRSEYDFACPNCKKRIDVVFDPRKLRMDGEAGDFVLNGRTCWNCGVPYQRLFAQQRPMQDLAPVHALSNGPIHDVGDVFVDGGVAGVPLKSPYGQFKDPIAIARGRLPAPNFIGRQRHTAVSFFRFVDVDFVQDAGCLPLRLSPLSPVPDPSPFHLVNIPSGSELWRLHLVSVSPIDQGDIAEIEVTQPVRLSATVLIASVEEDGRGGLYVDAAIMHDGGFASFPVTGDQASHLVAHLRQIAGEIESGVIAASAITRHHLDDSGSTLLIEYAVATQDLVPPTRSGHFLTEQRTAAAMAPRPFDQMGELPDADNPMLRAPWMLTNCDLLTIDSDDDGA